ncbi:MAG: ATP-dependent DNA helicase [Flavobacteriaceae bacterium]|nr:ATP-dependent DNA helicase [Flavobacteriaceae bacterium]
MHNFNLSKELKSNFGFSTFKGLQVPIITNILNGNNTFVVMPTGGGKSLCYQLPALLKVGTAIVVSPLIALMKNQVDMLRGISSENGIAHFLNSSLNKTQINQVKNDILHGRTKLLYVAPESLLKKENLSFFNKIQISFLAIDEAHCISEWGHDFRPDYRNIRVILDKIKKNIPIIAVTATATYKVQDDILKNLKIKNAKIYRASFNRPNLYYEVRNKNKTIDYEIIKFIKKNNGKSGIIYCLSRKKVEEISKLLNVNNIKAVPYHAGLESKTRSNNQDMFINEGCDVVVATIAFGMGIDKPDVRFVIHYDIPKSIESYYQETGRAGRDGGEGHCLAFYSPKDVEKLEKFMQGKPISEQELGLALLNEMAAYAQTSISRRKFLLHYFGEDFDLNKGEGAKMDDNMRYPKKKIEVKEYLINLLNVIIGANQKFKTKEIVKILLGKKNALINTNKLFHLSFFGSGNGKNENFWISLIRQALVEKILFKEIESYGVIKISKKGKMYLKEPTSFLMTLDQEYNYDETENSVHHNFNTHDQLLLKILKEERKRIAHKFSVPPYTIFQENSLLEMTIKYPISIDELKNINGVGEGKAKKNGMYFLPLIKNYVNENSISRPDDVIVKTTGLNSSLKLYLIQNIDRKLSLEDLIFSKNMSMDQLIKELEKIVLSGTKLDIRYWIDEIFDEEQQNELHDFFIDSIDDNLDHAIEEFGDTFEESDIRLYRINFLSEVAN